MKPLLLTICLLFCTSLYAQEPVTTGTNAKLAAIPTQYALTYDARYGSIRAKSFRSMSYDEKSDHWHMAAETGVRLLGKTLVKITEHSEFLWVEDNPVPLNYSYEQDGFGDRFRSITFDHNTRVARYQVGERQGELPLTGPVYDDLNSFLKIAHSLEEGATDIYLDVIEKGEIKPYHYHVLEHTVLETQIGSFNTVHIQRVRDEDSKRNTEFWLASDFQFMLLKLIQEEPSGKKIRLELKTAELDGIALTNLANSQPSGH